jgi:pimeloyl-ACP methyl ester carboxylesterase
MNPSPSPEGPGSVSGAPNLPAGFTDTFTSRYIDTGDLRLHAVTGGGGPPLLLVHGWPQTWYAWRMLMPVLARDFSVIAVDQRGIGLSDQPQDGYDTATLASDLVALMDALGHQRFAIYGTDVGMPIAYAVAADHRERLDRLVVSEAPLPGVSPSPPLFLPPLLNERLWHLAFNQLPKVNEQLVTGREDIFFGAEFDASAGTNKLPGDVVRYYIATLASDPDHLRGSFEFYRAIPTTIAQNEQRKTRRLTLPVLAIGGAESSGERGGEHDEARSGRRADPGHRRLRPLGGRAGSRTGAGRADHVPGPVPERVGPRRATQRRVVITRSSTCTIQPRQVETYVQRN